MTNAPRFALFLLLVGIGCFACFAQSESAAIVKQQQGEQAASTADADVTPLIYPYSISTEPHFAVFVEFPKADSIRRIALGDSNYFLAEADKTDAHYAIIKQIEAVGAYCIRRANGWACLAVSQTPTDPRVGLMSPAHELIRDVGQR